MAYRLDTMEEANIDPEVAQAAADAPSPEPVPLTKTEKRRARALKIQSEREAKAQKMEENRVKQRARKDERNRKAHPPEHINAPSGIKAENLAFSSTGWMGRYKTSAEIIALWAAGTLGEVLRDFCKVPFSDLK